MKTPTSHRKGFSAFLALLSARQWLIAAVIAALIGAAALGAVFAGASSTDKAPSGWKLVWHDEFNGSAGSLPNKKKWTYDIGCSGWGNNELECYTKRKQNVSMDGRGQLAIVARKESYNGHDYTSARILTEGLFAHEYGRFEARIKIPRGQGTWPAFWMLGSNFDTVGWPDCGEIDVMEEIGSQPQTVYGSMHGLGYTGSLIGSSYTLPKGTLADAYHVYAVEWSASKISWYVDGVRYETRTRKDLPAGAKWAFDHPFYITLNLAIGGDWPGSPDATTRFPAKLLVDYVRVYTRE